MKNNQCKRYWICPLKRYYENELIDKELIEKYCFDDWHICLRYQKEAAGVFHAENMLPDGSILKLK